MLWCKIKRYYRQARSYQNGKDLDKIYQVCYYI